MPYRHQGFLVIVKHTPNIREANSKGKINNRPLRPEVINCDMKPPWPPPPAQHSHPPRQP